MLLVIARRGIFKIWYSPSLHLVFTSVSQCVEKIDLVILALWESGSFWFPVVFSNMLYKIPLMDCLLARRCNFTRAFHTHMDFENDKLFCSMFSFIVHIPFLYSRLGYKIHRTLQLQNNFLDYWSKLLHWEILPTLLCVPTKDCGR